MKIKISITSAFYLFLWAAIYGHCFTSVLIRENPKNKMEQYLKTANIVSVEKADIGRTEPWIIHMDNGTLKRRAIFKHLNSPRPTIIPDSYMYEIAAYKLNKLLGIKMVPPLVERPIRGVHGSLQLMLENVISLEVMKRKKIKPPVPDQFSKNMESIELFEHLTYSKREDEDILINKDTWKIWRVDFSESFAPETRLFPEFNLKHCPKTLYNNLKTLNRKKIQAELNPYLNKQEIDALLKRKDLILEYIETLIEKQGKSALLF
ncbi:MAG: hypothetical protein ACOC5F_06290 [Candidatus Aminicenantaceae bacterium]